MDRNGGYERPSAQHQPSSVTFQEMERGDRAAPLPSETRTGAGRFTSSYMTHPLPPTPQDLEAADDDPFGARVGRKKSLVRPDRERIDPGHRQWYYRNHATQAESKGTGRFGLIPSCKQRPPPRRDARCHSRLIASDRQLPAGAPAPKRQVAARPRGGRPRVWPQPLQARRNPSSQAQSTQRAGSRVSGAHYQAPML